MLAACLLCSPSGTHIIYLCLYSLISRPLAHIWLLGAKGHRASSSASPRAKDHSYASRNNCFSFFLGVCRPEDILRRVSSGVTHLGSLRQSPRLAWSSLSRLFWLASQSGEILVCASPDLGRQAHAATYECGKSHTDPWAGKANTLLSAPSSQARKKQLPTNHCVASLTLRKS